MGDELCPPSCIYNSNQRITEVEKRMRKRIVALFRRPFLHTYKHWASSEGYGHEALSPGFLSKIPPVWLSGRRPFLFSSLSAFIYNITSNKLLKTKTKSSFLYVIVAVVLIFTYTLKKEEENVSADAFGVFGRFRRLAAILIRPENGSVIIARSLVTLLI